METEIAKLILSNGLPIVIMALIVMCLVGFVKVFTKGIVHVKDCSETKKKWLSKLYLLLALVFSYVCVIIYYAFILHVNCWTVEAVRDAGIVWTITSPLYQLYKQFGGRKLLIAIVSQVQKLFKGKDSNVDDILALVMGVLNEDAPLLTDTQIASIKENITNALSGKEEVKSEESTKETKVE